MEWPALDIVYVTAECIVGLASVLGNALVLLAIYRTRSLRTITNCFIGSLALADLLVGLIIVPVAVLPKSGLPKDFHGCVLLNTAVVLITNISILGLVGVALERYLAISDPFRYTRIMNHKRALIVVVVTWIIAIILGLIPTFGWNKGSEHFTVCIFTDVIDMTYMVYLIFFGVNIPPLVFMLVIYLYIFHIIRKQQQRMVAQLRVLSKEERKSQQNRRREVRGAKGLAYVIILFAVCWIPLHVLNCLSLFAPWIPVEFEYYYHVLLFCVVLSHFNSMVNPFLYAFSNSKFKRAMRRIVCCGKCQPANDQDSEMDSMVRSRVSPRYPGLSTSNGAVVNGASRTSDTKPPLYIKNSGVPTNGTGHVNPAFHEETESESDSEADGHHKSKKLNGDKPVAAHTTATVDANQSSSSPAAPAVQDTNASGDAVTVLGQSSGGGDKDDIHQTPGHVWATPSSRQLDQQDFVEKQGSKESLKDKDSTANNNAVFHKDDDNKQLTGVGGSGCSRPTSGQHESEEEEEEELSFTPCSSVQSPRNSVSDSASKPQSRVGHSSVSNPYVITDDSHPTIITDDTHPSNGVRKHSDTSLSPAGTREVVEGDSAVIINTSSEATVVQNDIDIHENEVGEVSHVRPTYQQQVSITGVSVQTDSHTATPHLRDVDGDDALSVTFSVTEVKNGEPHAEEFGSKEFVSIRL